MHRSTFQLDKMKRTVIEVQRDLARSSSAGGNIMWDSLTEDQSHILKEKINTLLPDNIKCQAAVAKAREELFVNIWSQRRYTNRVLLSAIIYVMVTEETDFELAKQSTSFSCHPVIRTRKCMSSDNSAGCCMLYIDEHSRVYQNWRLYLRNNLLPKGTIIAPANGVYTLNAADDVELEIHPTAARNSAMLRRTDAVAGIGGLVATAPLAAALLMPVAAPVMLAATAVTLTTATYSTIRSAFQLSDRYKHSQSTSLKNREARSSWLGVAGGVMGIGATGATKVLTCAAATGKEITLAAKVAVGGINVSSILISGTEFVNDVYDLYLKGNDQICSEDFLKLAASLLVFTHSINNLALVSRVPKRNSSSGIRSALSKLTRNTYNRISNGSSRNGGGTTTKLDLIRMVNNIPSKDVLMQQVGTMMINAGGAALSGNVAGILPQLINVTENDELNPVQLLALCGFKFVGNILNTNSFADVLATMATFVCEKSFYLLMNLTRTFMDELGDTLNGALQTFIPTEKVLYELFMYCVKNYSDLSCEYLESKQTEILLAIEKYFYSINPVNAAHKSYSCKRCNGYYYDCAL